MDLFIKVPSSNLPVGILNQVLSQFLKCFIIPENPIRGRDDLVFRQFFEVILDMKIFENGTASFGWNGPTREMEPTWEVHHFFQPKLPDVCAEDA